MRSIKSLLEKEKLALANFKSRIGGEFPGYSFQLTLFGSKARGDADPDSDMDVLLELDVPQIPLPEKRKLRRIAGEISLELGVLLSLVIVDQDTLKEKGDYAIFRNIQEEGIAL
jgi:uncharacterized protein